MPRWCEHAGILLEGREVVGLAVVNENILLVVLETDILEERRDRNIWLAILLDEVHLAILVDDIHLDGTDLVSSRTNLYRCFASKVSTS